MDRLPCGFIEEMIDSLQLARAYTANQTDPERWQSSPLRIRAKEIEHELAEEAMARG